MRPTAFLDRDGVINVDADYVHDPDEFQFIPGVFDACRQIMDCGYQIIVITNQAGIARGYYTEEAFAALTDWMTAQFESQGVSIAGVYYCPHHPQQGIGRYLRQCECRKPGTGMIDRAVAEHDVDLAHSFLVGDKTSDIVAGQRAGVHRNYLVETGKPLPPEHGADAVYPDLRTLMDTLDCDAAGGRA